MTVREEPVPGAMEGIRGASLPPALPAWADLLVDRLVGIRRDVVGVGSARVHELHRRSGEILPGLSDP